MPAAGEEINNLRDKVKLNSDISTPPTESHEKHLQIFTEYKNNESFSSVQREKVTNKENEKGNGSVSDRSEIFAKCGICKGDRWPSDASNFQLPEGPWIWDVQVNWRKKYAKRHENCIQAIK